MADSRLARVTGLGVTATDGAACPGFNFGGVTLRSEAGFFVFLVWAVLGSEGGSGSEGKVTAVDEAMSATWTVSVDNFLCRVRRIS